MSKQLPTLLLVSLSCAAAPLVASAVQIPLSASHGQDAQIIVTVREVGGLERDQGDLTFEFGLEGTLDTELLAVRDLQLTPNAVDFGSYGVTTDTFTVAAEFTEDPPGFDPPILRQQFVENLQIDVSLDFSTSIP